MTGTRDQLSDRLASHVVKPRTKQAPGYTTEDGQTIDPHTLFLYDCSCGYHGGVWYASEERALRSWSRHTEVTS